MRAAASCVLSLLLCPLGVVAWCATQGNTAMVLTAIAALLALAGGLTGWWAWRSRPVPTSSLRYRAAAWAGGLSGMLVFSVMALGAAVTWHGLEADWIKNVAARQLVAGDTAQARSQLQRALALDQRNHAAGQAQLPHDLRMLADLDDNDANFADAAAELQRAVGMEGATQDSELPDDLNTLGNVYVTAGDPAKAEPLLRQALALNRQRFGNDSPQAGTSLDLLGGVALTLGHPADALADYQQALQIYERTADMELGLELNNLGATLTALGRYREAESDLLRALDLARRFDDNPDHLYEAQFQGNLGDLYSAWNRPAQAAAAFAAAWAIVDARLTHAFAAEDEDSRLRLLRSLAGFYYADYGFAARYPAQPGVAEAAYNLALSQKGKVARGVAATGSGKPMPPDLSWRDLQMILGARDAAVEIVRAPVYQHRWSDQRQYLALVLTASGPPRAVPLGDAAALEGALAAYYHDVAFPDDGPTLGRCLTLGSEAPAIPPAAADPLALYRRFWQPLEAYLRGVDNVFLAADGALNQINLGLMRMPDGRFFVQHDAPRLRLLNSTGDLFGPLPPSDDHTAVLMANPYFDAGPADYHNALARLTRPGAAPAPASNPPSPAAARTTLGSCTTLPQVRSLELAADGVLAPLLRQHGYTTAVYTGADAILERLQTLHAPRVLHLATHGVFAPDQHAPVMDFGSVNPGSDPMLHSMLFFAGANHTLAGQSLPPPFSDGVLTARAASHLDLGGTELVVLNACQTGEGVGEDGEGVFGLRRGFQEAGAQAVLMSLWEVSATETNELVADFYRRWLDGTDKADALRQAELDERDIVRQRYGADLPYYWGAFILVGR